MDRRNLAPTIRVLVISLIVVGCTLAPGDIESETPIGTEPLAAQTLEARPAANRTASPTPHPFADVDFSVPQVHLYVPQPE